MNFIKEMFTKQLMVQSVELRKAENGREFIVARFRSFSQALDVFGEMSPKMGTKVVTRTFWDEFIDGDNVFKAHLLFEDYKMGMFKRGTILDGEIICADVEPYQIQDKTFNTKVVARIDIETLTQACKAAGNVLRVTSFNDENLEDVTEVPAGSLVEDSTFDDAVEVTDVSATTDEAQF